MKTFLTIAMAFAMAALSTITPTRAEEPKKPLLEIVVNDGVAFSWKKHEKGKRIDFDVVSAWENAKNGGEPAVADCDKFSTQLKGATWCFATAANLKRFLAETDKDGENSYLPFVGGRCALGASWGRLQAAGDPRSARIVQGDLGPMLVLHSHKKWWSVFSKNEFVRMQVAQMRVDFAMRVGDIVPNEKPRVESELRR
jgi:hypothetical protein